MYCVISNMLPKFLVILLSALVCCEGARIYSSFWAPLFDRRILNYRVDVPFDPDAGRSAREQFEEQYGYRGENLITDLGNGKGLDDEGKADRTNVYGDVKLYYTQGEAVAGYTT